MMISQESTFSPITITLTTEEEAKNLSAIIKWKSSELPAELRNFSKDISSWIDRSTAKTAHGISRDSSMAQQERKLLQPTYFVAHPDGSFSVADPQPEEIEGSKLKDQLNSLYQVLREAQITIRRSPLEPK